MNHPDRYSRNHTALSKQDMLLLKQAKVIVVGCGGLGGSVIEALARIGVGYLRVVDDDAFEQSNLNRQVLCTEATLGRQKALVAAERVHAINSDIEAEAIEERFAETNAIGLLSGMQCAVDCLDNLQSRALLGRACQKLGIPLIHGAIAGWFGQVCTVHPEDKSHEVLYGALAGNDLVDRERAAKHHAELGCLAPTAAVVAAVQAAEAVKVLLDKPGQLRNRVLMIDLLDGSFDEIRISD